MLVPPVYSGSGWKLKFKSLPLIVDENVPIPDVLPIDKKGYCVICASVSLFTTNTWCRALVEPLETLTMLLKLDISSCRKDDTVVAADTLAKFDSNLKVLSEPSIWPTDLNLYVLIPAVVVPIPMTDDLTKISFGSSFSNESENTPVDIPDIKVPIKFEVNASSVSVKNSDTKVFVPSWVAYNSTKLVSEVAGSSTSTEAKNASIFPIFADIISDVDAVETILLLPDRLTNPIDCVPIPAKFVLNVFWNILIS